MKTKILKPVIAAIFALIAINAVAQECGVYKTYEDYVNGKMEVSINCKTEKGKIKPNDFHNKEYITVIKNGEKTDYKKGEIFGYQNCNGEFFRFLNNERLALADKSDLWIFSKEEVVSHSPFTGTKTVTKYYFSLNDGEEIKSLTFNNLKDALPGNKVLFSEMELLFSSNSALHSYNQSTGAFKINSFLTSKGW